ncbi:hypothetical protein NUW58_g2684 [Xylaria curta]|uniref:Uncharacterized protein n=1 Tax=Xylaria curta TaxID=42375 RepID=A0ACC1PH43_9PEZI|nr:hypothetical protein NUW58_g2684 [Xylaria curta]
MEVVGLVAAVPGLVKLTKTTLSLLHDVSQSRKALSKVTNSLESQLQALSEVLELFTSRHHPDLLLSSQRQKLSPLIKQLHEQLESLNAFLTATRSKSRLQRMRIIVNNPKKKLQEDVQKLERSISIVKLYLLECNITSNEEAAATFLTAKKSELRNLLDPGGHDFIRTRLEGTFDWILSNSTFNQWLDASGPPRPIAAPRSRLLLIHGPKGSGKSVLAASTADRVRCNGRPCVFFSFFHGIGRQKKCKTMFSTILWQMLNFNGLSSHILNQVHDTISNSDSLSLAPLLQSIERVATIIKTPFYMIIDGIDESDDDWGDTEGPMKILEGWMDQFTQLRILLAGRQSALHHLLAKYSGIELSEDVTKGDISMMINHKIRESPHINAMPENLRNHVQKTLQDMSSGMFLWVELVFKELRHCHSPDSVRNCLQDLPRGLEAEYARLFSRLMYRLHSQVDRPTPAMRTARTLLALIASALEPLTADDLRHAYAASCGKGQMWEGELITEDAIFDLVGDFVTYTGSRIQHIHFCHSSLEEFLLLPKGNWTGSLKEIEFFRLEHLECHQLMARASLEFVTNFDFGYPLTEDSYDRLASKAFLLYATKNGFSHLSHSSSADITGSATQIESLKAYIACPNFGGLVEFLIITFMEKIEFMEDCISGLITDGLEELFPIVRNRAIAEHTHRVETFGPDDPRTRSWGEFLKSGEVNLLWSLSPGSERLQHIQGTSPDLIVTDIEKSKRRNNPSELSFQLTSPSNSSQNHAQAAMRRPKADIGATPPSDLLNAAVQSNIQGLTLPHTLRQAIQVWTDPRALLSKVLQSFIARLPIPFHLICASAMCTKWGDRELGIALFDLARQRTKNQRTLYRIWALRTGRLGLKHEERLRYRSEAQSIILGLGDSPVTRVIQYFNTEGLIELLDAAGRRTEVPQLIDDLLGKISKSHCGARGHRRQNYLHSIVYKTGTWRSVEIELLGYVGMTLYETAFYREAERVFAHACACAKARYGKHKPDAMHFQLHHVESLMRIMEYSEAEKILNEMLVARPSGPSMDFELYMASYYAGLTAQKLEKYDNASKILQRLLNDLEPEEIDNWRSLDIEKEELVIQARVLLLEVLASHKRLDPNHELQQTLLETCLKHLDQTHYADIRMLWFNDATWKCCVASDGVYGANHEVTWRFEEYLPYTGLQEPKEIYQCQYQGCSFFSTGNQTPRLDHPDHISPSFLMERDHGTV